MNIKRIIKLSLLCAIIGIQCQPPRLQNLENTCYMNSIIQNIYAIVPLTTILTSNQPEILYPLPTSNNDDLVLIARGYAQLVHAIQKGGYSFESVLTTYAKTVKKFMSQATGLGKWEQQDATEFITHLINQLVSYNAVSKLFFFELNSYLRDTQNKPQQLAIREPFYDLSLPIIKDSFEESLKHFFTEEKIETEKKDATGKVIETKIIYKQYKINTTSPVLITSLRRFSFDRITERASKISTDITPQFTLNLQPYLDPAADKNQQTNYKLIGIAIHSGSSTESGHYVAYVKNNGKWYFCNDSFYQLVDDSNGGIKEVPAYPISQGYMFTYIREDIHNELQLLFNVQELIENLSTLKEILVP